MSIAIRAAILTTISHRRKRKCSNLFIFLCLFLGLLTLAALTIKHIALPYMEDTLQKKLKHSGLSEFVHYETLDFDLLTLTPYMKNVQFGVQRAPWVTFEHLAFKHLPISYPNLNIDFRIKNQTANPLSRDTRHFMHAVGINELLGEGSIQATVSGNNITSQFHLDINGVGKFSLNSDIHLQDEPLSLFELRTDLLASLALGQPEAILIIHGDYLNINKMAIHYEDNGLINHLRSNMDTKTSDVTLAHTVIETMGLAKPHTQESDMIATELTHFLQSSHRLTLLLSPPTPLSLKTLTLSAGDDVLYQTGHMSLSAQAMLNK